MAKTEVMRFFDFSGGVNRKVSPYINSPNELAKGINVTLDKKLGALVKRNGYTSLGDDLGTGNILGLYGYEKADGTSIPLLVYGTDWYKLVDSTWTSLSQTLTASKKASHVTFLNQCFMSNGTDAMRNYDGTDVSTVRNVTGAPVVKYMEVYDTRVFGIGNSTYPSRLYYSKLPAEDNTIAWDTTNDWHDVQTDDNDIGMGIIKNGNRLLVFKDYSLYYWDTYNLKKIPDALGTPSSRSISNGKTRTYYFSRDGVSFYESGQVQIISRPIQPFIDGISETYYPSICGAAWKDHYYLFVGDISNTDEDISVTNALLDYHETTNSWTIHSLKTAPLVFSPMTVSSARSMYFGDNAGEVFKWLSGNNDDGSEIAAEAETPRIYFKYPELTKQPVKMWFFSKYGSDVSVSYNLDDGEWKRLGNLDEPVKKFNFPADIKTCHDIAFKFSETSSLAPFEIYGGAIYVDNKGDQD